MAGWIAVAGFLCLLYWFLGLFAKKRVGAAPLVSAVLLFGLAATTHLVDEKVDTGGKTAAANAPATASSDYFASQLPSFKPGATLQEVRIKGRPLCLVRYVPRRPGSDPGANWWTTCPFNHTLGSVAAVRTKLALPKAWGKRNERVVARIPVGETVTYLRGRAAKQCEPSGGKCYDGGGVQLLFRGQDFERSWFVRYECTTGAESAPARFTPCAG